MAERDYVWYDQQYFPLNYWPNIYYYWPLIGWVGAVYATLHERLFGSGTLEVRGFAGTLYERLFGSITLDDRDIGAGLHERKFGSGTLEDRA